MMSHPHSSFAAWSILLLSTATLSLPSRPATCRISGSDNQIRAEGFGDEDGRWVITVPDDSYDLCMATRLIENKGLAPVKSRTTLKAGAHDMRLKQSRDGEFWIITVTEKDKTLLSVAETDDWVYRPSVREGLHTTFGLQPHDKTGPGVFYRYRVKRQSIANRNIEDPGPYDGILVWLEKTEKLLINP